MSVPSTLQGTHDGCGGTVVFRPADHRLELLSGATVTLDAPCQQCGERLTADWALPARPAFAVAGGGAQAAPAAPARPRATTDPAMDEYMARFSARVELARNNLRRMHEELPSVLTAAVGEETFRTPRLTMPTAPAADPEPRTLSSSPVAFATAAPVAEPIPAPTFATPSFETPSFDDVAELPTLPEPRPEPQPAPAVAEAAPQLAPEFSPEPVSEAVVEPVIEAVAEPAPFVPELPPLAAAPVATFAPTDADVFPPAPAAPAPAAPAPAAPATDGAGDVWGGGAPSFAPPSGPPMVPATAAEVDPFAAALAEMPVAPVVAADMTAPMPALELVAEPVAERVAETIAEPVTQPITQPLAEPDVSVAFEPDRGFDWANDDAVAEPRRSLRDRMAKQPKEPKAPKQSRQRGRRGAGAQGPNDLPVPAVASSFAELEASDSTHVRRVKLGTVEILAIVVLAAIIGVSGFKVASGGASEAPVADTTTAEPVAIEPAAGTDAAAAAATKPAAKVAAKPAATPKKVAAKPAAATKAPDADGTIVGASDAADSAAAAEQVQVPTSAADTAGDAAADGSYDPFAQPK
ncbi:MAG: hypothetical protein JWM90_1929 [Thermoleophilia bacterium]|nr:hypothetical protein [Thermoleophilia bacterium]